MRWARQRITRGFSDYDIWDFDFFIRQIIIDGIREFAKHTESYPDGLTFEEWKDLLEQIASKLEFSIGTTIEEDKALDKYQKLINQSSDITEGKAAEMARRDYLEALRIGDEKRKIELEKSF